MSRPDLAPAALPAVTPCGLAAAYQRLLQVFGVTTQARLAACLGIRQASVSDALRRGRIPDGWLLAALTHKAVNPLWVLTGQGCQHLHPADGAPYLVPLGADLQHAPLDALLAELTQRLPGCVVTITRSASTMGSTMESTTQHLNTSQTTERSPA